jgi:hypothetical protein
MNATIMPGDQEMGSIPPPLEIPRQAHHHYFGHVYSQNRAPYNSQSAGFAVPNVFNVVDLGGEYNRKP